MKKLLLTLALVLGCFAAAQAQIGVIGGWTNSATTSVNNALNAKNANCWHAGIAYKVELGPLFTIQPALAYQVKGTEMTSTEALVEKVTSGFVEAQLGLQLGIDLLAFRPYVLLEPFVGFEVWGENLAGTADIRKQLADVRSKMEGGFGIGGGIELLNHLQFSVQWFMNFGKLYNAEKLATEALQKVGDINNYQGVKITLGLFF